MSFPPPRRPWVEPRPSFDVAAETPPPDSVGAWELTDDPARSREDAFADAMRVYQSLLLLMLVLPTTALLFTQTAATAAIIAVGLALDVPLFVMVVVFVMVQTLVLLAVASSSNWTALWGNQRLVRAVEGAVLEHTGRRGGWFVGLADPAKKTIRNQLVDTHEDMGLLFFEPDALIFEGIRRRWRLERADVRTLSSPLVWQFALQRATWCEVAHVSGAWRLESRRLATVHLNGEDTRKLRTLIEAWHSGRPGSLDDPD